MKNKDARFLLKEIDERLAKRKRPLFSETEAFLVGLRKELDAGGDTDKLTDKALLQLHEKFTEPARLK